jgi:hypothetical protein
MESIHRDGRGRPPKEPEEKKSELVTINVCPSEVLIVEQEAERCAIKESIVCRKYGFRKLEGKVTLPSPEVLNWGVGAGQLLMRNAKRGDLSRSDLTELSAEIGARKGEVKSKASRRKELRRRASEEQRTARKSFRVSEVRKKTLTELIQKRGLPSISTALGKGALRQIKKSEHLGDILKLLDKWDDQANGILQDLSESEKPLVGQKELIERIKTLGREMGKGAKKIHQARHK